VIERDERFSHRPRSAWPAPWRDQPAPEPLYTVALTCGCARRFEQPVPPCRAALLCQLHGPVRVVAVDAP
jgi:hypothetical protein